MSHQAQYTWSWFPLDAQVWTPDVFSNTPTYNTTKSSSHRAQAMKQVGFLNTDQNKQNANLLNSLPFFSLDWNGNTIGFYAHDEPLSSILVCKVLVFKLSSTWKIHQSQHPLILPQSLMKFALYLENFSGVIFHGTRQGHHWCLLLNQEDLGLLLEPSPALQRTQTQNFNSSDTSNEQKWQTRSTQKRSTPNLAYLSLMHISWLESTKTLTDIATQKPFSLNVAIRD